MKADAWIDFRPALALAPAHCDAWKLNSEGDPVANYWLTGQPNQGFPSGFYLDLGCVLEVTGFRLTNTHNYVWNDYSSKDFRIFLRDWEYPYRKDKDDKFRVDLSHVKDPNNKWNEVLKETLKDARNQVHYRNKFNHSFSSNVMLRAKCS